MRGASVLWISALCLGGCGDVGEMGPPSAGVPGEIPQIDQPARCDLLVQPAALAQRLALPLRPVEDSASGENQILPSPEPGQLQCAYAVDLDEEPDIFIEVKYDCSEVGIDSAPQAMTTTPPGEAYTGVALPIEGANARLFASRVDPLGIHQVVALDDAADCNYSVVTTRLPAEQTAIVAQHVATILTRDNRPQTMHSPREPWPEPPEAI